ncbi:hypothetical protein [Enterococcus gallinarum]|uniref:hypothetical protein n=1 Tax=Enterococcus gallinarum TaxID=1353 RepID=UPI001F04D12F|nr:hypothetical protein [Enterococcus gallinarum]
MTLKIDNAIEEIERALAGNKPKYANDIYLKNAIRYLQEIKSPSLTDDQQVVLEWLKDNGTPKEPFWALDDLNGELFYNRGFKTCISAAFSKLNSQQQYQVLAAFAEWGMEQEEE